MELHRLYTQRYCNKCQAEYMRTRKRLSNRNDPVQQFKNKARRKANWALIKGLIQKHSCSCCGDQKSEMHHEDYNKPLEVIWLCRSCHGGVHRTPQPSIYDRVLKESKTN